MNESKIRGLKLNLKKVRGSILHFSLIFLSSTTGYNNLLLSICCKSVVINIVDLAFFSLFCLFFI